ADGVQQPANDETGHAETADQDHGHGDPDQLQQLPRGAGRAQLTVTRDGLASPARLAHSVPFTEMRRVWDSNPRDIAAHWFSRPGPSAARTTLPGPARTGRSGVESIGSGGKRFQPHRFSRAHLGKPWIQVPAPLVVAQARRDETRPPAHAP